jgi:hypothetical protein
VALKYAMPGKVVSTRNGERVLFTLVDQRVMFLDLGVAKQIEDLHVNVREKFFVCRSPSGTNDVEWTVWRSPETEKAHAEATRKAQQVREVEEETPLEQKLRESIELAKQKEKWGEVGNGTFVVPSGASASTPAPVQSGAANGHQNANNGHGSTNGTNGKNGNGNGNGAPKHPDPSETPVWAQSLLEQANALVDVYAAALSTASAKHGNQIKPEDVRSLLVTVFIQRSKVMSYGA